MAGYVNEDRKMLNVPKLAINEKYNFYSPGVLLVSETARYMMEQLKYTCLYMGRGDEKYKLDMGGQCFKSLHLDVDLKV